MIRWKCPQCQSTIGAPEWSAARRVPCPVCTNGIKVPAASDDDPTVDADGHPQKKNSGLCGCIVVFMIVIFFIFVVVKLLS